MIQAMAMVLDFAPDHWTSGQRLVALALADRVNGDTLECYPSVADLSRRTGLSERMVQRYLRDLEADGVIENLGQRTLRGKPSSNVYRWLLVMKLSTGSEGRGDTYVTGRGDTHVTPFMRGGVTPMSPEPLLLTTNKTHVRSKLQAVDNF